MYLMFEGLNSFPNMLQLMITNSHDEIISYRPINNVKKKIRNNSLILQRINILYILKRFNMLLKTVLKTELKTELKTALKTKLENVRLLFSYSTATTT